MSLTGERLAAAAMELVGTPFRLHGRDARTGLDCVGLLSASLARCGAVADLPTAYRMRMTGIETILPDPDLLGFVPGDPPFEIGDVILQRLGPAQFHIAIATFGERWVHAHAGLRRVVLSPTLCDGPVVHHWRVASAA